MPSSLFNCVNAQDLAQVRNMAAQYQKMSKAVVPAACAAGEVMLANMKRIGQGEYSIRDFHVLIDRFRVTADQENVYVGLPPNSRLTPAAEAMDKLYQLNEVVIDLAKQSGDVEEKFLAELAAEGSM